VLIKVLKRLQESLPKHSIFIISKRWVLLVKKTTLYAEREQEKRQELLAEIKQIKPEYLVFLGESGIDQYLHRYYARAKRGEQVITEVYGKKHDCTMCF